MSDNPIFTQLMNEYREAGREVRLRRNYSKDIMTWLITQRIGMSVYDPAVFSAIKGII